MKVRSFQKVAISNRSEVAVRIIRACQELNLQTVLLHSEADTQTLAYRMADETVCIGSAHSQDSYLDIEKNITASLSVGADALHPGFGFLSENPDFVHRLPKRKFGLYWSSRFGHESFWQQSQSPKACSSGPLSCAERL